MENKNFTLITGASSGMGAATSILLSKERNLILSGRNKERLLNVYSECQKGKYSTLIFPFDLVNASGIATALKEFIKDKQIEIEAFVHFAGMTEVLPISKTKYSVGLEVMNVNYFSATEIISTLLKRRINNNALRNIILVSSIIADGGKKYQPHYCASKGALKSLAKALACELAPEIRVNVISPGSFNTRIVNTLFSSNNSENWNPPSLLNPGDVIEVAKVARFLLSNDSEYITGQTIYVDGGERFPHL